MNNATPLHQDQHDKSVNWGGRVKSILILAFLALVTTLGPQTTATSPVQVDNVHLALQQLVQEQPQDMVDVIVQKIGGAGVELLVSELGGTVKRELGFINGFSAEIPAGALPALASAHGVHWISLDAPMVSTQTSDPAVLTVRDEFNQTAYDNNDGLAQWASDWQEIGESQSPGWGFVEIDDAHRCANFTCLHLGDYSDHEYHVDGRGLSRAVDLDNARWATLTFEYALRTGGDDDDDDDEEGSFDVILSISGDSGTSWTDLAVYHVADDDHSLLLQTFDITAYASAETQIRFLAYGRVGEETSNYFYVDNVEIAYSPLPRSVFPQAVGADKLWYQPAPINGDQVTVAVVDSGIADHADLSNGENGSSRIQADVDFVSEAPVADDRYGHGTHVAGIIAGNDQLRGLGYKGIAPGARIVDVKALDDAGAGHLSDVIDSLNWVYEHKDQHGIRVVNLSLNSSVIESYHDSPLAAAIEILWLNDVVVVVSAGNNGTSAPGVLYPPANDPYAIVVGAVDDQGTADIGDDVMASYSAYGVTPEGVAKPDLVAPGNNIVSLLAGDTANLATNHADHVVLSEAEGGYMKMSGTSLSSAVVAGAVAQLLQAEPTLTADQVKYRLMSTARTDWASYDPQKAGAGYLDIYAAVNTPTTERANESNSPHHLLAKMAMVAYWASENGGDDIDWEHVDWASVNWASVNWASVNWASVNWASVNWASVNWASANWASTSETSLYWEP